MHMHDLRYLPVSGLCAGVSQSREWRRCRQENIRQLDVQTELTANRAMLGMQAGNRAGKEWRASKQAARQVRRGSPAGNQAGNQAGSQAGEER
jgi:hypothetical protein